MKKIYKFLCSPSQKGRFFVCLHIHMEAIFGSSTLKTVGEKPVPSSVEEETFSLLSLVYLLIILIIIIFVVKLLSRKKK